eukprot:806680-Pleurochrysis_carterae.AAC.4
MEPVFANEQSGRTKPFVLLGCSFALSALRPRALLPSQSIIDRLMDDADRKAAASVRANQESNSPRTTCAAFEVFSFVA